jgi:hypothetical protein
MRKLISLIILSILFLSGCKSSTEPVPPEKKPPGYQENITWPSLANSPWPMFHGNPQGTGRTKEITSVSLQNLIAIQIEGGTSFSSISSPIIGRDSTIYFASSLESDSNCTNCKSFLYAITGENEILWKLPLDGRGQGCLSPLVDNKGTIYVATIDGYLYAVDPFGNIKWKYYAGIVGFGGEGVYIDKNGSIYLLSGNGNLMSLTNSGEIRWNLKFDNGFLFSSNHSIVFSPDGNSLYVAGVDSTLYSIDTNGKLNWAFNNGGHIFHSPLVDSQGNIYFGTNDSNGKNGIYSLTPGGKIRWFYESTPSNQNPTMDKDGNLYFSAEGKLISLDWTGKLRWTKQFNVISHLICSDDGKIFFFGEKPTLLNKDGNILAQYQDYLQVGGSPGVNYAGKIISCESYPVKQLVIFN